MTRPVVVNPRPSDQAADLSELLRVAGFEPLEQPTIVIEPVWSAADAANVLSELRAGAYAWIVLPSRTAARELIDGLRAAGATDADVRAVPLLSGPGTAETLRDLGVQPTTVLERFSSTAALAALQTSSAKVLVPRAAEGRDELITGLAARGVRVDAPVVYETRLIAPALLAPIVPRLRAGEIAAFTLTSPSTVRGLVTGLLTLGEEPRGVLGASALVCIGETTAAELRAADLPIAAIAERTSLDALVDAVRRALAGVRTPEAIHR
jgi:uroporphyrinogen-III synthase